MSSQVLDKTDYSGYAPLGSKRVDVDQLRRGKVNASDQMYSDIGINGDSTRYWQNPTPAKKRDPELISQRQTFLSPGARPQQAQDNGAYSQAEQKQKFLSSALDSHGYALGQTQPRTARAAREPTTYETSSAAGHVPLRPSQTNSSR